MHHFFLLLVSELILSRFAYI